MCSSVSSSEEELENGKPNQGEDLPKGSIHCHTSGGVHYCLYGLSLITDPFTGIEEASESEEEEYEEDKAGRGKTRGQLDKKKTWQWIPPLTMKCEYAWMNLWVNLERWRVLVCHSQQQQVWDLRRWLWGKAALCLHGEWVQLRGSFSAILLVDFSFFQLLSSPLSCRSSRPVYADMDAVRQAAPGPAGPRGGHPQSQPPPLGCKPHYLLLLQATEDTIPARHLKRVKPKRLMILRWQWIHCLPPSPQVRGRLLELMLQRPSARPGIRTQDCVKREPLLASLPVKVPRDFIWSCWGRQ